MLDAQNKGAKFKRHGVQALSLIHFTYQWQFSAVSPVQEYHK